jgi:hypothetical protein
MDITYIDVGDAYLLTNNEKFPIARLQVTYELDELPRADIMLATGTSLDDLKTITPIKNLIEGGACELHLVVNDDDHLLLDGFITGISGADSTTPFKSITSLEVQIEHKLRRLAGSPATSMAYVGDNDFISVRENIVALFVQTGTVADNANVNIESYSDFMFILDSKGISGSFIPAVIKEAASNAASVAGDPAIIKYLDFIKLYEGADISKLSIGSDTLITSIARKYREAWSVTNNWEALRKVAEYMFLSLVPYNNGIYIANTLALGRQHAIELTPNDYNLWLLNSSGRATKEPVDGVICRAPLAPSVNTDSIRIAFPPLEGQGGENLRGEKGKYYHFRSLPEWVYPHASVMYSSRSGKVDKDNKGAVNKKDVATGGKSIEDYITSVGQEVTKVMYSFLKLRKRAGQISTSFRTDIMPGTNIKFKNTDAESVSFIGDTLYGMATKVVITADMTQQNGSLTTGIDISALRNEQDNKNDDVTFENHPIYSTLWKGVKLNGELL